MRASKERFLRSRARPRIISVEEMTPSEEAREREICQGEIANIKAEKRDSWRFLVRNKAKKKIPIMPREPKRAGVKRTANSFKPKAATAGTAV